MAFFYLTLEDQDKVWFYITRNLERLNLHQEIFFYQHHIKEQLRSKQNCP